MGLVRGGIEAKGYSELAGEIPSVVDLDVPSGAVECLLVGLSNDWAGKRH